MKVKELKELIASAPDDAVVVCNDLYTASIHITGVAIVGKILYLDCNQVFPEEWYEDGEEKGYDYSQDE